MFQRTGLALRASLIAALLSIGLPQLASANQFPLIQANDPLAQFTASSGTLSTTPGDATIVLPTNLGGNTAILDLALTSSEAIGTIGTQFSGTLVIEDGTATPVLVASVNSIVVTNLGVGPSGAAGTFLNLGGLDTAGQAELTLLGGSAAAQFGGAGTTGQMFISLSQLVGQPFFIPLGAGPGFFPSDFTADTTIQVLFHTPEPGTALLLGASLAALAGWRRRRALV